MKHKVVKLQFLMGLACVLVVAVISRNANIILSASVGFSLACIPTIVYSMIAFSKGLVVLPSVAYMQHQKAMIVRFLLNILLFGLTVLYYRQCNFIVLFIAYFITLSAYWFSLIRK